MDNSLEQFSAEELQAELGRRECAKQLAVRCPEPAPIPNWDSVAQVCIGHVQDVWRDGWVVDDYEHYIYEAAVCAVYGPGIFNALNERDTNLNKLSAV